jgi:hypothetical protein
MAEDWEAGGQEVTTQQVGFNVVNDHIKGTFTSKKYIEGKKVFLYELKGILGSYHRLGEGRKVEADATVVKAGDYYNVWGGKTAIDDLFTKSQLGDIVAIKFEGEVQGKDTSKNPFKKFKCLMFGRDVNYMGEDSAAQAAVDESGI